MSRVGQLLNSISIPYAREFKLPAYAWYSSPIPVRKFRNEIMMELG